MKLESEKNGAIRLAAYNGQIETVKLLLESGADDVRQAFSEDDLQMLYQIGQDDVLKLINEALSHPQP